MIAYLSNEYPSVVESYVMQEIDALRRHGANVVSCSVLRVNRCADGDLGRCARETLVLWPSSLLVALHALDLMVRRWHDLSEIVRRVVQGPEPHTRKLRALVHTWLGACLAIRLRRKAIDHIHVHHGYAASWIGMVAARLSNTRFSFTLHGSDLLLHPAYLDVKLKFCKLCVTISEFNRQEILRRYSEVEAGKVLVQRMGVACFAQCSRRSRSGRPFQILTVGRLHPVKNHGFLLQACFRLRQKGFSFRCVIVGDGPERNALQQSVTRLQLQDCVLLAGHVAPLDLERYYSDADLVVLTSRSEGIPLVLMEAMAHERPVLAPAITGIPELVLDGMTGFLYRPDAIDDFVAKVELIRSTYSALDPLLSRARDHVMEHFDQKTNVEGFCQLLLSRIVRKEVECDANSVLQQI